MEYTELTVRLIVLFIPGIIETFIYEVCQNRSDMNNRDFVINVVLSAFIAYSVTYVIFKHMGGGTSFFDALLDSSIRISMTEIMVASVLSIVFGFLEAKVVRGTILIDKKRNERHSKARLSVWDELFDENDGYDGHVKIILNDQEIIYEGYVAKYSASVMNKKEICLRDAVKYDLKTGDVLQKEIDEVYLQIRDDEDIVIEMIKGI